MKLAISLLPVLALSALALSIPPSLHPRLEINQVLALISRLFPFNVSLDAAQRLNVAAEETLALAQGFRTTRDGLSDGTCSDLLVIFARGTHEPGNVGALVGPPFFRALESVSGPSHTVAVQGVDYDATVADYLEGGDPDGSQEMASLVTKAMSQCPDSKIVVSGYSQGGQLVHKAARLLPAAAMEAVSSVIIFGDPNSSQAVENADPAKVLVVCHKGDDICQFGKYVLLEHLTYAADANTAAAFVVSRAGF